MQTQVIGHHPMTKTGHPADCVFLAVSRAMGLTPSTIWSPLTGGRTNRVWHLHDPECVASVSEAFVVKHYMPDAGTPLFRNDPQAEHAMLQASSLDGLTPDLVMSGHTDAGAFVVYRYLKGEPWRVGAGDVGITLRTLHDVADPPIMPLAPDGSEELMAQTLAILDAINDPRADDLRSLQPRTSVPASGLRRLLHGDTVPGNLICLSGRPGYPPILIDWQCPVLGDPVLDLAMFLSPAMQHIGRGKPLDKREINDFLTAYDDRAATERFHQMQALLHWRMAAYCLWKITRPLPDDAYVEGLRLERAALLELC